MQLTKRQTGAIYAISSGLLYGFVGYFGVSLMHAGMSVYNMLFWRFFVATLFALLMLAPHYQATIRFSREGLKALAYGMIFYGASATAYFISSSYIGTGLAMVMFFAFPAFVIILNVILHNAKISKAYYLAFFITALGMLCLIDQHELTFDLAGIGFGLLAAFSYACYIVASKKISLAPKFSTLMVSTGCMLTCLLAALLDSSFYMPSGIYTWLNILGIATISTAIPILLLLQALKYISSEQASMLSVFEPVFVLMLGIVLLGETVTAIQIIGASIVLSGALLIILIDKPKVLDNL